MAEIKTIKHKLGGITAIYTIIDGITTFTAVPAGMLSKVDGKKLTLEGVKYNRPDPMVQVSVFGDAVNRQYSAGQTMRNGESCFQLKFAGQNKVTGAEDTDIVTYFNRDGVRTAEHHLLYREGRKFLECYTVYVNGGESDITLEMLSSFSIGSLTPFALDNPAGGIRLHRLRSQWSAEAQLETRTVEDLLMEPSWMNYGVRGERFGAIGSTPARNFIPFAALTDTLNGVTWAVNIGCGSSWQMEFYLAQNSVNLSGGIADFEFGHWRKVLKPGESITTPRACFTVIRGGVDEASQILTERQKEYPKPACEQALPIIYNEYCNTWGRCSLDNILPLINSASDFGIDYFVIDAGWYEKLDKSAGFYTPRKDYYPNGLEEVVRIINARGMRAGLWFEYESREYDELAGVFDGHLLTRDGKVIRNLERAFVDMRDPYVIGLLKKDVIGLLRDKGFGYVKVDYNENIGVGCDGAESIGEGLRQQVLAAQEFFGEIKRELPDIVLEMCASGGMRHEPSMIALGDQMSYSDIHESDEGAAVAGDLHRIIQPDRCQVWAVLRSTDDERRMVNTISKCFLGRMCFSGDIDGLNARQTDIVKDAVALYRKCAHVIKDGFSYFLGKYNRSMRDPKGWKAVLREGAGGVVFTVHAFSEQKILKIKHKTLIDKKIDGVFKASGASARIENGGLIIEDMQARSGVVVYLSKGDI